MLEERLREWAAGRGYGLAIANVGVVATVRKKLEARRDSGLIDPVFFAENLSKFRFLEGVEMAGPKRVVMVAVPSPVSIVPVKTGGRTIETLIPPTYVHYLGLFQQVLDDMKTSVLGPGAIVEVLKAPLKSLAVHTGLVRYGRNNITYAPGLGSGLQLCGYVVATEEWPAEAPPPGEGREIVLDRCSSCTACVKACPTGAIHEDRFLIHAERCFVLPSESTRPLPAWVRPPKSVCLIGCMDCQLVCPENKGCLKTVESGVELTAEETGAMIEAGSKPTDSPELASARTKFDGLGMAEDFPVLGRNLGLFIPPRRSSRRP
jgi:epoxyqueuosine reductase